MAESVIISNVGFPCMSHEKHTGLCSFLLGESFSAEEFRYELRYLPKTDVFFHSLCYFSIFKNAEIHDFAAWYENAKQAISTVAQVCEYPLRDTAERNFYALALAINTFTFDSRRSELVLDEDVVAGYIEMPAETPEQIWAMYLILAAALDKLEFEPKEERNTSLFIRLLKRTLELKEPFEKLKTYLYDSEKGVIFYNERKNLRSDA